MGGDVLSPQASQNQYFIYRNPSNLVSLSQEMAPTATQLPTPETQESCDIPPSCSSPYIKPPKPPLQSYLPTSSILLHSSHMGIECTSPSCSGYYHMFFLCLECSSFLSQLIPKPWLNCPTLGKPCLNLQCQVGLHSVCFHCICIFLLQYLSQL